VGEGKIKPSEMPAIIDGKDRNLAGPTAPAKGLALVEIKY
jgi:tRNA pseudouridine38-40 synthase